MKILHLTTVRVLYSGQRRQLEYEVDAVSAAGLDWHTRALHTEAPLNAFERQIPRPFRSRLMLRVYGWIFAVRCARRYDLILLRDMQLDILGPMLGLFARNRFTVHHAKEIEELSILRGGGVMSRVAVLMEKFIKPLTMRSASGLAAVTHEIREYEIARFPRLRERAIVLPNGCSFNEIPIVADLRRQDRLTFTFVCAEFSDWHGLDRLLDALEVGATGLHTPLQVHLVGLLDDAQRSRAEKWDVPNVDLVMHGMLNSEQIGSLLSETNVAIGSLALDRKNLREASTLKVREYLASGVPVYATHRDAALPADFPFFVNDQRVSLANLMRLAIETSTIGREEVRTASKRYIDKRAILEVAVQELEARFRPAPSRRGT